MRRSQSVFILHLVFCLLAMASPLVGETQDSIKNAEQFMQKSQFENAIKELALVKGDQRDYAQWLTALSYSKLGNATQSLTIGLAFKDQFPQSKWLHKVNFLLAEMYLKQKNYQAAEKIYSEESTRLLSEERKKENAEVYIKLAERLSYKPLPEEIELPKPDYVTAYKYYKEALQLEIGPALSESIRYSMAKTMEMAKNFQQALVEYKEYLETYDTDTRIKGAHIGEARLGLAQMLIKLGRNLEARTTLEDLIELMKKTGTNPDQSKRLTRLAMRTLPFTFRIPNPPTDFDLDNGIKTIDALLKAFPNDSISVTLAWYKAQSQINRGRTDDAIVSLVDIYEKKNFQVAASETLDEKNLRQDFDILLNPEEQFAKYQKEALAQLGDLYFKQNKYVLAMKTYSDYIAQFPNGPHWTKAQKGLVDAEYQMGIDKIQEKNYQEAEKIWDKFLINHPLDSRSQRILFTLAQVQYQSGLDLKPVDKGKSTEAFVSAINGFKKLVSKYPGTEEASLAQFAVGEIQEQQLGDFEAALKTYKQLTWGSKASEASYRVSRMTAKELTIRTQRVFRTDEQAVVSVQLRNIDKLKVSAYKINLESYFRKFHSIAGIENLDLALIQPDKTWDVSVKGYTKYLPVDQDIPIPSTGPGAWAVTVSSTELESTTLVIQSDLDVLVKSSRKEMVVFVQDRKKNLGVKDARVLVTDGKKVLLETKTGADGTLIKSLPELANGQELNAFVEFGGNVAATGLNLSGLSVSSGLVPKGYIYTDKPAYNPGETVHVKGILRDVVNGSYAIPQNGPFTVSIVDPTGKSVLKEVRTLGEFGTLSSDFSLSSRSPQGQYAVTISNKDATRHFNGSFQVQVFKLEKIKLNLDFDRPVFFRGESIKATFHALYYFGQPVGNHDIQYRTPDGLTHDAKTDAAGNLIVEFDTTPYLPGQVLSFHASLSGENVSTEKSVSLATQEFTLKLSSVKDVILAGTPHEFTLRAQDVAGNPLSREVEIDFIKRVTQKADPLLTSVPWLAEAGQEVQTYTETIVQKIKVQTDQQGIARFTLSPQTGGTYLVRARAKDRFENSITTDEAFFVSDESDQTLLRLLPKKSTYVVGSADELIVHSRFKTPTLALVCVEGEGIIQYQVMTLDKRETRFPFKVGNEHFPNFTVEVSCMGQGRLHEASVPFDVERQLTMTIKPSAPAYKPGENAQIEVTVVDHLGKPVSAEFSLSLVNESLLRLFDSPSPPIVAFFQDGVRRLSPMKSQSSAGFSYSPATRAVNQDIATEEARIAQTKAANGPKVEAEKRRLDEPSAPEELDLMADDKATLGFATTSESPAAQRGQLAKEEAPAPRREIESESFWTASIVTNQNGKATLTVPMPEQTSAFVFQAKGVSKESLVGESSTSVLIRKDFFADLKTPAVLQENDEVQFTGRIHNLTNFKGPATATLTLLVDGKSVQLPGLDLTIDPNESKELVFAGYKIPNALQIGVRLDVKAGANQQDSLLVNLPVRPWGLPWSVRQTGTSSDSLTIFTELPADKKYESQSLTVAVSPPTNEALVQQILHPGPSPIWALRTPFVTGPEAKLHALVALSEYLAGKGTAPGTSAEIRSQILATITDLVSSQQSDGSWSLSGQVEDVNITAQAYWSLVQATKNGFSVDSNTLQIAKTFLKNRFTSLSQDENEYKAIIQYALAFSGDADYSFVNRLYRIRNELSEASLLFTALTLAKMEKGEMGLEVLALLGAKAQSVSIDSGVGLPKTGRFWTGSSNNPWLRNPVEATALAVIAYQTLKPQDPLVAQAILYLQFVSNPDGWNPEKSVGYVTQALTQFYGPTKNASEDYSVQVLVNDQSVGTIRVKTGTEFNPDDQTFQVLPELLKPGKNKIQFTYSGKGEYGYLIDFTGFSKDMKDPKSWSSPSFAAKKYIHEAIRYKGSPIAESTMNIAQLEMTQTSEVEIVIDGGYRKGYTVLEDFIPAGAVVLQDSIRGDFTTVSIENSKLLFYFRPGEYISTIRYTIASYAPGKYQVLPPVLREVFSPSEMRLGKEGRLQILAPGEKSSETYVMNDSELFALGSAHFKDGSYKTALELLETLGDRSPKSNQPDLARMLLWIRTEPEFFDGKKIVGAFEILKEKYPELSIPFSKIMTVGKAYHDIGEFERSYLIYRAVVDSSFLKDSAVAGNLEKAGEVLGSIDFMTKLWTEYNDSSTVISALFSLAQAVYGLAPDAEKISSRGITSKMTIADLLEKSSKMLWTFASSYPDSELADDAAFTMLNISLDEKNYQQVIDFSKTYQKTYAASPFFSNYQYIEALAEFSLRKYQEAILTAKKVAEGTSENKDLSTYILGQIYHSQRKPEEALTYYKAIQDQFPDAAEAIRYFEDKSISMDEINLHAPGDKIVLPIKYRNVKELNLQVYKVDLMKLYLREKNLSKITKVNLAGITPSIEKTMTLGVGKDYQDKETQIPLALNEEGAYLVVCRGDELFTSGLVLISPLRIEVQEDTDSQRVRVNVFDSVKQIYPDGVHVKVVGSNANQLVSGETDLRGIFIADGISGITTVIAQDQSNRYAFYRGSQWIGPTDEENVPSQTTSSNADFDTQYRGNDFKTLENLKQSNRENLDKLYQEGVDGVQIQQVK